MRQPGEPSVEEILASIKQVIARDNRAATTAAERRRTEPRAFDPAAEAAALAAGHADDEDDDGVLDLSQLAGVEPAPLIADEAISSMRESLAALATMATPGAQPQIVRSGETSLEGLVRELLRPMLADWLDKNLPPLVERLVATEIARIVGKKG